ncbi:astacin-like metalloprotease toxin 5 [Lepeophtheirus salmonis]|uniref:astacin-like metalloprotease toxin 5 n=1 Tax=Lepeophtheirus salmonis TaxID=72036 RepID=UPI001AEAB597|nr:astacin-like metalloprotease toxin 5 [Lepeophtheirus salmonis]
MMERSISKMILIYILVLFQLISKGHALIQCGARDPNEHVESRNLMSGMGSRWPNSTVPYKIGSGLIHYSSMIKSAMEHIESNSCVKFVQQSKQKTYLNIVNNKPEYECFTTIGYSTQRENFLHLRLPQCLQFGIIVHELLHALGFDHEHNRYDRDEYIRIHWQNLMPGGISNFYKSKKKGIFLSCLFAMLNHQWILQIAIMDTHSRLTAMRMIMDRLCITAELLMDTMDEPQLLQ